MNRIILPSRFRQKGSIGQFAAGATGLTSLILSGGDGGLVQEIDVGAPFDTTVGIRFLTNGQVQTGKENDGGGVQWSNAGTWIEPQAAADSSYDVRFTNFVQVQPPGDWTTEAAADNIWIGLGAQREWLMNNTVSQEWEFDCDFEVRKNGGGPPATGSSSWTFKILNTV